ncbi:MAG: ShlB/FhaC/HecB family hemolysin secretion/activation protein [Azoarcus sp.]|nr:ShlB/FhaC/HecB family hemolysin secretion/activation protein [Azoarcus sp.]
MDFETHGESRLHQLGLERLLHRDGASKTGANPRPHAARSASTTGGASATSSSTSSSADRAS